MTQGARALLSNWTAPATLKDGLLTTESCTERLMRKATPYKLILLAILVVSNITILGYLWLRNGSRGKEMSASEVRLPSMQLIDDRGARVLLPSFIGVPVVIAFVNPEIPTQTDSVSKLVSAFNPGEVRFVLITPNSRHLRGLLPNLAEDVIVVQSNYAELKRAFGVPECCERRFIFNSDGSLSYRDYYYDADLTPRINPLAKKTLPPVSTAIIDALKACRTGAFAALRDQTRNGSRRALVMLFTSVSSTCPSGDLLKMAARQVKGKGNDLRILVPKEYSQTDCENLRTNFKLNVSVGRFDSELQEKWKTLIGVYGEAKVNGTVVLVEHGSVSLLTDLSQVERELGQL